MQTPHRIVLLAFNGRNQLAVRENDGRAELAFVGGDLDSALREVEREFPKHTRPAEEFEAGPLRVRLVQVEEERSRLRPADGTTARLGVAFRSLEDLHARPESLAPDLRAVLSGLEPHLFRVPYLHLDENEFIHRFRPEKERNTSVYAQDEASTALYQSQLCAAIKAIARQHERSAAAPVTLDFGVVRHVLPSHFGFCLGVKNAVERAYETLAQNPGRRVFMLSELIHNPFVNEDLLRRGLGYLQTDKGVPYTVAGVPASGAPGERLLWDTLGGEDIVIIPAFGATNEDKRRLVRKGLSVYQHDATCMLVEKVWKAARSFGREGYTVVIHGKHEHEETKATFSNALPYAPAVIVRDLAEARQLAAIIREKDPAARRKFHEVFAGRHSPGFDVAKDLERVAVVNQTTLLMNETLEITELLRRTYREVYGDDARVGGGGRRDTLCYATQVNQDALGRGLERPLDAAFVIGGRNSSNTHQLHRLCAEKLGARAFFISSERDILSPAEVRHFAYGPGGGRTELRPLWTELETPREVLLTGGASCPDGIIQQVIARLNGFFPPEKLRPVEDVLREVASGNA